MMEELKRLYRMKHLAEINKYLMDKSYSLHVHPQLSESSELSAELMALLKLKLDITSLYEPLDTPCLS